MNPTAGLERWVRGHESIWTLLGVIAALFGIFWTLSKHFGWMHPADPKA
jgi:hypothetical protein